jgi:hypothetical protein
VTILCDPGTRYQSRLFDAAVSAASRLAQAFTEAKPG